MHSVQTQVSAESSISHGTTIKELAVFRRLKEISAAIFGRSAEVEAETEAKTKAVRGYEGYAWCDSSERNVTFDITACRRTWIF